MHAMAVTHGNVYAVHVYVGLMREGKAPRPGVRFPPPPLPHNRHECNRFGTKSSQISALRGFSHAGIPTCKNTFHAPE
jgi:hypothetical protein